MKKIAVGAVAALSLLSSAAYAETFLNGQSVYGRPASADAKPARVVDVATAKHVNVTCGEAVTFVNGANRFTWKFDVANHRAIPIDKIAPAGFGPSAYTVYVSRSEMERGG